MSIMKNTCFLLALACVLFQHGNAKTCKECTDDVGSDKDCGSAKTYVQCLYDASGENCDNVIDKMKNAKKLITDAQNCDLTDTCECQSNLKLADIGDDTKKCKAHKDELKCLLKTTENGCDSTKNKVSILENSESATKKIPKCALTDTCVCQIQLGKADVGNDMKKCKEQKKELNCLLKTKGAGCDSTKTKINVLTDAETDTKKVKDCDLTDTCKCQIQRGKADVGNDTKKCKAQQNELNCLLKTTGAGCDSTKSKIKVLTDAEIDTKNVKDCALTSTCKCQISLGKADVRDTNKKCKAGKNAKTCLDKIQKKSDVGCDGTTNVTKVMRDFVNKLITPECGSGSESITGIGLTVGICVVLLEMIRMI